ncbi:MAG: hypothetical protein IH600_10600 [Bacteroidetes bacterium]|nr:hypothetical protein [Bacteroidota bacterium]
MHVIQTQNRGIAHRICLHLPRLLLLFPLLFALQAGGCSDDDPPVDPWNGTLDTRIVGDWALCNESWEYGYSGMRIDADGHITVLGIDWSTGKSCVLTSTPYNVWAEIETRDNRLVYKQVERAYDTLTWTLNGDRMEWFKVVGFPDRRLRRIQPEQQMTEAVPMLFSATISGVPFQLKSRAPWLPVFARMEPCGTVTDLGIGCSQDWAFDFVVHDYTGPGSYPLTMSGIGHGRVSQIDGDMIWSGYTDSTHTGTITILSFDQSLKRCKGTFEFDALMAGGGDIREVRNGVFDLPITR